MKRLKYFTNYADIVKASQSELSQKGISSRRLHIFFKDKRHDNAPIMLTEKEYNEILLKNKILVISVVSLVSTLALTLQIINMLGFAILVTIFSFLSYAYKRFSFSDNINKNMLNKGYFLIVDIDDKEEDVVVKVIKNYPGLVAQ